MKSYYHHPGSLTCVFETIPERMKALAEEGADKIAMVIYGSASERHAINRKDLYHNSAKFGLALIKLGIQKGNHVTYCMSNNINWLAYNAGIMKAGGVPVNLPYSANVGAADLKAALAGCSAVILDSKKDWDAFLGFAQISAGGKVSCSAFPSLKFAIATSSENRPSNALLAAELMAEIDSLPNLQSMFKFPPVDPEDIAFVCLYPGEGNTHKLIKHSHLDVINCPSFLCEGESVTGNDVRFSSGPMAKPCDYPFGYLQKGTKFVNGAQAFLNDANNFNNVVDIWKKEGCTVLSLTNQNMKLLKNFGFRVKMISTTGKELTKEMVQNAFNLSDQVVVMYDNAEALRISHSVYTKANVDTFANGKFGSPSEGVEIKIVNKQGKAVEMGEIGFVCVRSPWLSRDYNLSTPLVNGWQHTTYTARMLPGGEIVIA